MNNDVATLIGMGVITTALLVGGKILSAVQDWFIKTILKKPTAKQTAAEASLRAIDQLLELRDKKRANYEQYKVSAKHVVRRAVDLYVNLQLDIARSTLLGLATTRPKRLIAEEHLYILDLVGESARFMQIELYMDSVDANGFTKKQDFEWKAFLSSGFDSVASSTAAYYQKRCSAKVAHFDKVLQAIDVLHDDFFAIYTDALTQIRTCAFRVEADNAAISAQIESMMDTLSGKNTLKKKEE
jgi:hypothetical protein